ncbi:MAG TPA: MraY family glycosyltransferase [Candidatus Limnocylindrales bacterium]|nr:MraY family glycosyltransferase [Candidatus Limnocylindrales bacterium]
MSSIWIAFSIALLASLILTAPVRQFALRIGMVDQPSTRKVHVTPVPLLGGVAIYAAFVLAVVLTIRDGARAEVLAILAGATLLAITGILDDTGKLHHQIKLFISMPLAACILLAFGIHAQVFADFLSGRLGAILDIALTLFWVVGITAAFSILDHLDGLCAGVAAVAAAFFTIAAFLNGQFLVGTLAAAALGAALGFLRWNFAPARIFMGDGGAMLLGFLMATLGLKLRPVDAHSPAGWLLPVLILGVPVFDTTLIAISRSRRGLVPFTSPGKDHTAHRLSNIGFGHKGAVLFLYGMGGVFGALGLLVTYLPSPGAYALCGVLIAAGAVAVIALERSPFERQEKPHRAALASLNPTSPHQPL